MNRLAAYWSEQDLYHRGHDEARLEALYTQPDLFHAAARGVSPMNQLDDGANFVLSESIRLRGVAPSEEFGVGLAFLLKSLDLVQTYDWPFFGVDSLDRVFEPKEE